MTRGIQVHRLKDNPMEARFAEAWSRQQAASRTLDYILDTQGNVPRDPVPASLRDQTVAATVVQWLGSPVGQSFLADAREPVTAKGYMNSALSAEDLVERAVRNAGRCGGYPKVRWGYVADLFAIGSTSASGLCRRFDLDPDEMLGEYPDE